MELLYTLTLLPIELVMRFALEWAYRLSHNYGWAIIILSLVVNTALLPVYYAAERWRGQDQKRRDAMQGMLDKIKANYKGKERYYYIQSLYRIHGYRPLSSVKASVGLLIQIPFFFAAYQLLSQYQPLQGVSFWVLNDLSQPDGLLFGLNLLPFVMTVVNLTAAMLYIKNYDNKGKYQLWGMALFFLVVLYSQASGLLLYWTINNLFSLVKNLVEKVVGFDISKVLDKRAKRKAATQPKHQSTQQTQDQLQPTAHFEATNQSTPQLAMQSAAQSTSRATTRRADGSSIGPHGVGVQQNYLATAEGVELNHSTTTQADKWTQFFLGLLGISVLLLIYNLIAIHYVPEGINYQFNVKGLEYSIPIPIISLVVLFMLTLWKKRGSFNLNNQVRFFDRYDLLLLLIPLTPIIQYAILNTDMLTQNDIVYFLGQSLFVAVVGVLVIPYLLSLFFSKAVLTSFATGYVFTFFYMPSLAAIMTWHLKGRSGRQFAVLFLVMGVVYFLRRKGTRLYSISVLAFAIVSIAHVYINKDDLIKEIQGGESDYYISENHSIYQAIAAEKEFVEKNDIVILSYESYVTQETMGFYGVDISEQIDFLRANGFTIYDENYSLAPNTMDSLARTLSISRDISKNPRHYTEGRSLVTELLKKEGYKTFGVFPGEYYFRDPNIDWDGYFPILNEKPYDLFEAVKEGEFRFDFESQRINYTDYLKAKRDVLATTAESPYFLLTHNNHPGHTQMSGKCLPHELQKYIDHVEVANKEMREDVEIVVKTNPDAIVVVVGDHGPQNTKNCAGLSRYPTEKIDRYDIQDRYGAFLAIRWPEGFNDSHPIQVNPDIFPAILANLYRDERIWLEGRPSSKTVRNVAGRGVHVENGIITGGIDDGEPLYLGLEATPRPVDRDL